MLVVAGGLKLILGDTRDRYAAWADLGLLKKYLLLIIRVGFGIFNFRLDLKIPKIPKKIPSEKSHESQNPQIHKIPKISRKSQNPGDVKNLV